MSKSIHTEKQYLNLVDEMLEHDRLYYIECKPIITDYEYDQLLKALEKWEEQHPSEILSYSPTQRVSGGVSKGFKQKNHVTQMLSLANTYTKEEVEDFIKRIEKLTGRNKNLFCVELKMDGTAVSLRYEKGNLTRALTRGNGKVGDDITANMKTVKSVPLKLPCREFPDVLEVRGEVFMPRKSFQNLNKKREETGLDL